MSSRQIGRQQFLRPSGRAPHLVGQCPIGERFGEMDAANFVGAIEIGECTGYAQHAVIAACRQPHGIGGLAQERKPARIRPRHILEHRARDGGVAVQMRQTDRRIARRLPLARCSDTLGNFAASSAGGGKRRSAAVTAGTSICRSMRSMRGPDMRVW
jgi:hypothetical protein